MRSSSQDIPIVSLMPGTSPFCVKGTLWLGIRQYVDAHVEGGLDRVNEQLDAPTRAFFSQMFLATSWFDLFPVLHVFKAISTVTGVSFNEQAKRTATWHGEQDLNGTYKTMLKQSSPQAVCKRFAGIYSKLYNFGRVDVIDDEERSVESRVYGFPKPAVGWWMRATESYTQPLLLAAGAKNVKTTWMPLEPDGDQAGVPLVRTRSFVTWE